MASNARPISAVLAAARRQPTERKRFIKFLIVGAVGFVVDFGGFNLFHALGLGRTLAGLIPPGLPQVFDLATHPEIIEQSLSFICAVLSNFAWNYFWIYPEARSANQAKKITKFFIVSVAGLFIGVPVFTVALSLWQPTVETLGLQALLPAGLKLNVAGNLALMTRVGTLMLWNFFVNRYWTYRDVKR
ncbi:MAG TPA: GtrA family protein [Anaerolineales bacterium]|nr:GtrA family protein [Anaerolineales bacterium]